MKKVIIGGILAGLAMVAIVFVIHPLTLDLIAMSPSVMWKPASPVLLAVYYFVVGFILAYAYSVLKNSVPGSGIKKGVIFGLLVFLLGMIPGLGITWITMNIRNKLIFMWLIMGILEYIAAGTVIQIVDEKI